MTAALQAPPLVQCARCGNPDDLSQMTGTDTKVCGPCWLAEARRRHKTDLRDEVTLRFRIEEA